MEVFVVIHKNLKNIIVTLLVLACFFLAAVMMRGTLALAEDSAGTRSADEDVLDVFRLKDKGKTAIQGSSGIINNLSLRVGGVGGTETVDVNALPTPEHITWPLTTLRRTIEIHADFSDVGISKERRIVVDIPAGYNILEYTARTGTSVGGGITELFLSEEDDSKIESSILTAIDGTDWLTQGIGGHTGRNSGAIVFERTRHGRVEYTFNSNTDSITLTLILGHHRHVMSHAATSLLLDPIVVTMTSGTEELESRLHSTITGFAPPTIHSSSVANGGSRQVAFDSTTGLTETFRTSFQTAMHTAAVGVQTHLAENVTFTVNYPAGVTFIGFREHITARNRPTNNSYVTNHLIVADDSINRQVTFTYSNIRLDHHSTPVFELFWEADVDGTILEANIAHPFAGSIAIQYTDGSSRSHSANVNITFVEPVYDVVLTPINVMRRDLNEQGNFPYSYMLGGFSIANNGSIPTPDLHYRMTFPDELFIRAIRTPRSGAGTVSRNVIAITNERTITLPGPFTNIIRSEDLGLGSTEILRELAADLTPLGVGANTTGSVDGHGFLYYGRFQNGQTGGVELTIYERDTDNVIASAIDQTTIGWTDTAAGSVTTHVRHSDNGVRAFFPNDTMYFTSTYTMGQVLRSQNDIVDPQMIISLPEGINLDLTSVEVLSRAGNHGNTRFSPALISTQTQVINGVNWITYIFSSPNHQDIIANASNMSGVEVPHLSVVLTFNAIVSALSPGFPELRAQDLVLWDIGQNAINSTAAVNFVVIDTHNRAGNGVGYRLVAGVTSIETQVVRAPGFNVMLGIRPAGSTTPFFSYDGTDATIAQIPADEHAEIFLGYDNNDATALFPGTEIYLPIPKAGVSYNHFFNNIELRNPLNPTYANHVATLWSGILTEEINLPGFNTLYGVGISATTNGGQVVGNNWVPVNGTTGPEDGWYSFAQLTAAGHTLVDVNMVKFRAYETIEAFASEDTTFSMAIADDASVGDVNFWRTYQKGWRDAVGFGTWTHGSVIAAESNAVLRNLVVENDPDHLTLTDQTEGGEHYVGTQIILNPGSVTVTVSKWVFVEWQLSYTDINGNLVEQTFTTPNQNFTMPHSLVDTDVILTAVWAEIEEFELIKTDDEGQVLSGAEFSLERYVEDNDGADGTWEEVEQVSSDEDGLVSFSGLRRGSSYRLIEISAPAGFATPAGHWIIEVSMAGEITVTQSDELQPELEQVETCIEEDSAPLCEYHWIVVNFAALEFDFEFIKTDEGIYETSDEFDALAVLRLNGAVFTLERCLSISDADTCADDEWELVGEAISSEVAAGLVQFSGLTTNTLYRLTETVVPQEPRDFRLPDGHWYIRFDEDGDMIADYPRAIGEWIPDFINQDGEWFVGNADETKKG